MTMLESFVFAFDKDWQLLFAHLMVVDTQVSQQNGPAEVQQTATDVAASAAKVCVGVCISEGSGGGQRPGGHV